MVTHPAGIASLSNEDFRTRVGNWAYSFNPAYTPFMLALTDDLSPDSLEVTMSMTELHRRVSYWFKVNFDVGAMSPRTVRRRLKNLRDAGIITVTQPTGDRSLKHYAFDFSAVLLDRRYDYDFPTSN